MKCPECGKGTITYNTRDKDGSRWRRRECANGHRFTTYEVPATTIDAAISTLQGAARAKLSDLLSPEALRRIDEELASR